MDVNSIVEAIKKAKESSKKRNFSQSFDLIVNLKDLDMKRPEHQVDFFIQLPHGKGKPIKVAGLIGPELIDEAKANLDFFVLQDDFDKFADKKKQKKLADEYDFFLGQANLMTKIAAVFGRTLGPRAKMPNPKAGCVVPPKIALKPLVDRLKKTIRVSAKTQPILQVMVGHEKMDDKQVAENFFAVYNQLLSVLPNGKQNIRNVALKLTMGAPIKLEV